MDNPQYKILIADNQPIVTYGLQHLFNSHFKCEALGVVNNGSSLLSFLNKNRSVNTLLIDLSLDRTNIYALIKEIIEVFPNLKIIVFTNYDMPKLVQSIMEYGVHAYLSKTAEIKEIFETIRQVHEGIQIISPSVYNKSAPAGKINDDLMKSRDYFTRFSELTKREIEIVSLLSKGMSTKEMAKELNISVHTVETHRKNLIKKLGLKTSAQIVYLATLQGLV